jgi:hypothetical protein
MNRVLHHQASTTKSRSNSGASSLVSSPSNINGSKTLRKSIADAEDSVLGDVATAVAEAQHSDSASNASSRRGIVNLKDIIIEQAAKDRSTTPSSTMAMTGTSTHKGRPTSLKDSLATKAS